MVNLRNYQADKETLKSFLNDYCQDDGNTKKFIYREQIVNISKRDQNYLHVNLDDLNEYEPEIVAAVENNALRYQKLFCEAIDEIVHESGDIVIKDAYDIFIDHRIRALQNQHENANERVTIAELRKAFPQELLRRYEVGLRARQSAAVLSIRQILSREIGRLVKVRAIVTRTSQIKPLYRIATYSCDKCGSETYQELLNKAFLPLTVCQSESCRRDSSKQAGRLHMQTRGSKKVQLQELRIQEVSDQVPVGNIPRSMTVHCLGHNARLVQPGEHVLVTGVFLPLVRNTPHRSAALGIALEMFLDCHEIASVSKHSDSVDLVSPDFQPSQEELDRMKNTDMYRLMAASIAPEIFGHEDVKRAILVLLVGGTGVVGGSGGTKIRGAINLCLMGDPGVAKSQLLTFVDRLSPRSQYTTGRGSSGVGLTAAVCRDQLTGEMTLEAGSLVLADGGVCCIDEFDKMAETDRTAIHEVMEQQTISIAKAGIMTTLNARVSILAAANPAYGRYNPRRSIEQNIDLPAALLSRFDLIWLIQDKPDRENDLRLAQHITYVHTNNAAPPPPTATTNGGQNTPLLSMDELRRCLAIIRRQPDPTVPAALVNYLVGVYVSLRRESKIPQGGRASKDTTYTCARTLLGLLRIATALARLRLTTQVDQTDVDEAIRLLEASKASVRADRDRQGGSGTGTGTAGGYKEAIYQHIRRLAADIAGGSLKMADISKKCVAMGFTPDQINEVIDCYEELNVWQLNVGRTRVTMVN